MKTRFTWLILGSALVHAAMLSGAAFYGGRADARVWPVDITVVVELQPEAPSLTPEPPQPVSPTPVAQPEPTPVAPPAPVPEPEPPAPAAAVVPRLQSHDIQPPEPPAMEAIPMPDPPGVESIPAPTPAPAPTPNIARTVSATLVFNPEPAQSPTAPASGAVGAAPTPALAASAVAPSLLSGNPTPTYPLAARRASLEGTVVLKVGISAEGRVVEVRVDRSSGHPILDQEAVRTARRWRFTPAQEHGRRTSSELSIPVRFVLTD